MNMMRKKKLSHMMITEVSGNVIRKVEITRDEQAQTDNEQAQE